MRFRPLQLGFVDRRLIGGTVIVLILIALVMPNFVKARTTRSRDSRLEFARWIEAAKQVWAAENNKAGSSVPTIKELKPFLQRIRSHPDSQLGPRMLPIAIIGAETNLRVAEWEFSIGSVTQRVSGGSAWDELYFQERYATIIANWPQAKKP